MQAPVKSEPKEKFVARVENTFKGNQFIKQLKKHLNKNTYDIRVRYSGKRPKGTNQVSTRKENATSMRVYITAESSVSTEQQLQLKYVELLKAYNNIQNTLRNLLKQS